jgi:hypothetical protein
VTLRVTDNESTVDSDGTLVVIGDNPVSVINEVVESLEPLAGDKYVQKAIGKLNKALDAFDGDMPTKKVFKEVSKAVKELLKAERKNGTDVGSRIAALVVASRASAVTAIEDAEDGDPKRIEKAISELDKGDREAEKGKPDKAVDKYGKAWEKARKAIS